MNDSNSAAQASRFYEQHRVVVDNKDSKSGAEDFNAIHRLGLLMT